MSTVEHVSLAAVVEDAPPEDAGLRIGVFGEEYAAGRFDSEYHADLTDPRERFKLLNQLRIGNSTIASQLAQIEAILRQAPWSVEDGEALPDLPSVAAAKRQAGDAAVEDLAMEDAKTRARLIVQSNLFGGPATEYAMQTSWRGQFLHEALTSLAFGFAAFEVTWRLQNGRLGQAVVVDRFSWLWPESIAEWRVARDGRFLGVYQESSHGWNESVAPTRTGSQTEFRRTFIPVDKLLVITRWREGDNPEGVALIRHMYGDARRLEKFLAWFAIDAHNRSVGIPYAEATEKAGAQDVERAERVLRRLTYGAKESAYVVAPHPFKFKMLDMSADPVDLSRAIEQHENRIRQVSGSAFQNLGQVGSSSGGRAVGEVQAGYFDMHVQGIGEGVLEDVQRQVVDRAHAWNHGTRSELPAAKLSLGDTAETDTEGITKAIESGGLQADGDIEQSLRRAFKQPLLDADEVEDRNRRRRLPSLGGEGFGLRTLMAFAEWSARTGYMDVPQLAQLMSTVTRQGEWSDPSRLALYLQQQAQQPAGGGGFDKTQARQFAALLPDVKMRTEFLRHVELAGEDAPARKWWREPTAHEAAHVRLAKIDETLRSWQEKWVARIRPLWEDLARKAAEKSKPGADGLLEVTPPSTDRILAAMRQLGGTLAKFGRDELAREAKSTFGVKLAASPLAKTTARPTVAKVTKRADDTMEAVYQLDTERMLNDIVDTLRRGFNDGIRANKSVEESLAGALDSLLSRSDAGFDLMARSEGSAAFNGGRAVGIQELVESGADVEYVTISEAMDDNTCVPCEKLDGKAVKVGSDEYWEYLTGAGCLGGPRCRRTYVLG